MVVQALVKLVNVVWRLEKIPYLWKVGRIIPIFKGGDISDLGDYRGINLLSIIGKLVEALVYDRLVKFVEGKNGLSDEQWGFRSGRSAIDLIFL